MTIDTARRALEVEWTSAKDGGYKTGRIVLVSDPAMPNILVPIRRIVDQVPTVSGVVACTRFTLIRHSCTGELEYVQDTLLRPRPMREDYEDKTQSTKAS
jgi:hypothetical protein